MSSANIYLIGSLFYEVAHQPRVSVVAVLAAQAPTPTKARASRAVTSPTMSFLHAFRRPPRLHASFALRRAYATKPAAEAPKTLAAETTTEAQAELDVVSRSACAPGTILPGLNYLKDEPPIVALPDDQYPEWLWTLLDPPKIEDDGPGGLAEKRMLRKANRQRIREQNFMKTQ